MARRRPFSSLDHFAGLRADTLRARRASHQPQLLQLPLASTCADYKKLVCWGEAMREAQALFEMAPLRQALEDVLLEDALDRVLRTSADLVEMLRQPRWGLPICYGRPATLNPLLLLHEQLARSVELLLLVRARAAPAIPPEVWALVVEQVLSTTTGSGGGSGSSRPVLRHYGYANDGSLRLALDPPVRLPQLRRFRASVGAVLNVLGSSGNSVPVGPDAVAAADAPRWRELHLRAWRRVPGRQGVWLRRRRRDEPGGVLRAGERQPARPQHRRCAVGAVAARLHLRARLRHVRADARNARRERKPPAAGRLACSVVRSTGVAFLRSGSNPRLVASHTRAH